MEKKKRKKGTEKLAYDWGRRGGVANVKKNGKKHMSEIGKLGAKKRWENKKINNK